MITHTDQMNAEAAAETEAESFLAYCEATGWDPEDPEARVWYAAYVSGDSA